MRKLTDLRRPTWTSHLISTNNMFVKTAEQNKWREFVVNLPSCTPAFVIRSSLKDIARFMQRCCKFYYQFWPYIITCDKFLPYRKYFDLRSLFSVANRGRAKLFDKLANISYRLFKCQETNLSVIASHTFNYLNCTLSTYSCSVHAIQMQTECMCKDF